MTWLLIMRRDLKIKYPPTYMLKFSFPHLMKTDTMPMTSATMAQMRTHWGSLRKYEAGYGSGSQSCFHSIFSNIYAFWVCYATRKWNQFKPCSFPSLLVCQRPTVTVSQADRSHHHQQLWDHLANWKATTVVGRMEKHGISFAVEGTLAFLSEIWNTEIWFDLDS